MQEAALLKAHCAVRMQEHDSLQSDNDRLEAELQLAREEIARVRGLLDNQVLCIAVPVLHTWRYWCLSQSDRGLISMCLSLTGQGGQGSSAQGSGGGEATDRPGPGREGEHA